MGFYVYRVENEDGVGPYQGLKDRSWTTKDHVISNKTPMEFWPADQYKYGFRTKTQLHSWFSKRELQRLEKFGFKVKRLLVKKIINQTNKQLIFR